MECVYIRRKMDALHHRAASTMENVDLMALTVYFPLRGAWHPSQIVLFMENVVSTEASVLPHHMDVNKAKTVWNLGVVDMNKVLALLHQWAVLAQRNVRKKVFVSTTK